jgi:hypothetical protein
MHYPPFGGAVEEIHEKTRAFGHGFLESEELGDSIKTSRATLRQMREMMFPRSSGFSGKRLLSTSMMRSLPLS